MSAHEVAQSVPDLSQDDLTGLYGGEPTWRRFLDRNYWVMQRAAFSRWLSLRYWTALGCRSNWLTGWTDDCMGRPDPFAATDDDRWFRAYRAGRYHCGRYL